MQTVYNFNAGPAMLPTEVMEKAREEFLNYKGSGMSVMEVSHRGTHFLDLLNSAEENLKSLLKIPSSHSVAFFPGGATLQFSAVPLNFLGTLETAAYSLTGVWSNKAFSEAKKLGYKVESVYDGKENGYTQVPNEFHPDLLKNKKYLYITSNNTIYGSRYPTFPHLGNVPYVADMTSELLSRPLSIKDFGYIFAGAQKNIGPSGLTIGIIRNDLLEWKKSNVPVLLDFKVYFENKSLYNTPPTFSIYIAGLVFEWCIQMGGIEALEKRNEEKANLIYNYIDNSDYYKAPIQKSSRSPMNVVFLINNPELEKKFNLDAEKEGLYGLAGHRDVGGLRASLYNAMPIEGVQKLIDFMKYFKEKNI
jgi:phosphoserine aminotransferase